jgi:hypothetical protein
MTKWKIVCRVEDWEMFVFKDYRDAEASANAHTIETGHLVRIEPMPEPFEELI